MKCGAYYEERFKRKGYNLVMGVDEAGRGCLAGPVVAAAVILKKARFKNRIDDSKKLSARQRENAFLEILDNSIFGIGIVDEKMVDSLNILNATRMAMKQAIEALIDKLKYRKVSKKIHILIDGNIKLDIKLPFTNIIKGDAKSKSIASASILAKVTRDRIMSLYHKVYPQYGFMRHKGYATQMHREAIKKFGPSLIHRKTFTGV